MFHIDVGEEWPTECERKYERLEILGKGSFGMVWMSRRVKHPENEEDDEFVAIKSIHIKNEKGKIYAEREIRILQELRHPNVIRLIKAYPVFAQSRVVVMQLARGPNLHDLVVKRGALGLPLSRFVSRQLIAAVSYIHGRAVIHRDIKPSNGTCHNFLDMSFCAALRTQKLIRTIYCFYLEIMCRLNSCKNYPFVLAVILSLNNAQKDVDYDWFSDDAIWSSKEDGTGAIQSGKWRVMLVDFGFARALEKDELESQSKKMRNSILFEGKSPSQAELKPEESKSYTPRSMYPTTIAEEESMHPGNADDDSLEADMAVLESMVIEAAAGLRKSYYEAQSPAEEAVMGETAETVRKRHSGVSMAVPPPRPKPRTSRLHVRSMSALGTKAYAAPEIRRQLRRKNEADFEKANAAMTECVADYGMIVDAYSVGWTLRVAMTGS